jgi:glycerol-1-phosphate dehydrogenase [NAD(P)+]
LGRFKRTVNAQGPQAIYAHLPTLCAAPPPMVAAGFGDMLGKHTSLADWRLGHLLWDEPYDASVAAETAGALARCEAHIESIRRSEPEGIQALTEALIVSGLAMLRFGDSRPASGAEHHLSHYWEMRLLIEGRPALLHGAKVGVACVRMSERYRALARLSAEEVATLLEDTRYMPGTAQELNAIRQAYGEIADEIIAYHQPFLEASEYDLSAVRERIVSHWPEVQAIARDVPLPSVLASQIRAVGGPATVEELGLHPKEGMAAEAFAHYLRPRFTVLKLGKLLGLLPRS